MAARLPSWAWVTGLTVGATVAVVALAVQADKGPHPTAATARPSASASVSAHPSPKPKRPVAPAVPAASGSGRRVVYSLGQKRVWLVDASDKATRTFGVWPGTVSPAAGSYSVTQRTPGPMTGSDGVKIEHIVYFATAPGANVAFSNAVDGSSPPPATGVQTGGIRMHTADGAAVWSFGTAGTKVTVVK